MTGNIIIKVGNTIKFKDEKWQKSSSASKMHISKSGWKVQRKVEHYYTSKKRSNQKKNVIKYFLNNLKTIKCL